MNVPLDDISTHPPNDHIFELDYPMIKPNPNFPSH